MYKARMSGSVTEESNREKVLGKVVIQGQTEDDERGVTKKMEGKRGEELKRRRKKKGRRTGRLYEVTKVALKEERNGMVI
jgi:hypothetical protein